MSALKCLPARVSVKHAARVIDQGVWSQVYDADTIDFEIVPLGENAGDRLSSGHHANEFGSVINRCPEHPSHWRFAVTMVLCNKLLCSVELDLLETQSKVQRPVDGITVHQYILHSYTCFAQYPRPPLLACTGTDRIDPTSLICLAACFDANFTSLGEDLCDLEAREIATGGAYLHEGPPLGICRGSRLSRRPWLLANPTAFQLSLFAAGFIRDNGAHPGYSEFICREITVLLSSLIKDANDVCSRTPEQLGCPLLQVINSLGPNDRHRRNFLLSEATAGYPDSDKPRLQEAITEAWQWLTVQGYLSPRPDSMDSEFIQLSRSGHEFLRTCQGSQEGNVAPPSRSERVPNDMQPSPSEFSDDVKVDPGSSPAESRSELPSGSTSGGRESIDANSVSDEATTRDSLDFEPYVNALSEFLLHKKTQPPLTLAIEGEWGSGKSSFMLQLQKHLEKKSPRDRIVCFNPWRYEKQDELWAAFALQLTRTLREKSPFFRRSWGDLVLFFKRIKGFAGWANFATLVLLWLVALFGALAIFHWAATKTPAEQQVIVTNIAGGGSEKKESAGPDQTVKPGKSAESSDKPVNAGGAPAEKNTQLESKPGKVNPLYQWLLAWGNRGGAAAILLAIIASVWKSIRARLLDVRLERFIERPDYKGHASFIEDFHSDFAKAVESYTLGKDSKVFVFIDDLDRCEVPKAAELIQAINLLIGDGKQLIYIIAIDRQKVAAGIAQKFKDLLEFLPEYEDKDGITVRSKLAFGYAFLEKFIQLSVRVPAQDDPKKVEQFLNDLVSPPPSVTPTKQTYLQRSVTRIQSFVRRKDRAASGAPSPVETAIPEQRESPQDAPDPPAFDPNRVEFNGESERARGVVLMVRHVFRNNPRRLKIFLNSFRLSVYLASSQGLLDIDRRSRRQVATLEQLGKFIALTMKFPELLDVLAKNTAALADYEKAFLSSAGWPSEVPQWLNKDGVAELFRYMGVATQTASARTPEYSFQDFPVGKMLSAVPLLPIPSPVDFLPARLRPPAESFLASLDQKTPRRNTLLQEITAEAKRLQFVDQLVERAASGGELDTFMALGIAADQDLIQNSDDSRIDRWYRLAVRHIGEGDSPHADYVELRALWALREMAKSGRLSFRRSELFSVLSENMSRLEQHPNRRTMADEILKLMSSSVMSAESVPR